jgi:hypothetical protein
MPSAPKKVDVPKSIPLEGMQVSSVEFKPIEDQHEKALRLHKERVSFYVKEIATLIFAVVLVIVVVSYSFMIFASPQASASEKEWARSALMLALGGAVGFAFGKTTK